MSKTLSIPPRPCTACPYRTSTPAGVWSAEEYSKLPAYDADTGDQPMAVFLCHAGDAATDICKGWVACHGGELLAYRLAVMTGRLEPSEGDFDCPDEIHPSGEAAAVFGLSQIDHPDSKAIRTMDQLMQKHPRLREMETDGSAKEQR